ncbi:unnamed protein product [Pleuronectes platessa]|uniref:Uncharacterized protein n=1 Tax=Pleuronectes platessa TaxID=8262 RepID=A0A9N7Z9M9_PLEPL|nr:unnamed protein product [Pleuronectes platessa]
MEQLHQDLVVVVGVVVGCVRLGVEDFSVSAATATTLTTHQHPPGLLLHHHPSAELQHNPKLWSAARESTTSARDPAEVQWTTSRRGEESATGHTQHTDATNNSPWRSVMEFNCLLADPTMNSSFLTSFHSNTVSSLYAAGQMFSLDVLHRGGLSGVVYFSPEAGGAAREGSASLPTIHQRLTELMNEEEKELHTHNYLLECNIFPRVNGDVLGLFQCAAPQRGVKVAARGASFSDDLSSVVPVHSDLCLKPPGSDALKLLQATPLLPINGCRSFLIKPECATKRLLASPHADKEPSVYGDYLFSAPSLCPGNIAVDRIAPVTLWSDRRLALTPPDVTSHPRVTSRHGDIVNIKTVKLCLLATRSGVSQRLQRWTGNNALFFPPEPSWSARGGVLHHTAAKHNPTNAVSQGRLLDNRGIGILGDERRCPGSQGPLSVPWAGHVLPAEKCDRGT